MGSRDQWYEDAVIYSVDAETFLDADGDGVGDFRGLRSQLDYLDSLGVNCIWLLPFYTTPNRDNGYDVADYYGVDSRLGTPGDVVEFVREAEERGIRVIVDLVVNHTSDQHPWFQAAREDPESPYRDYYIWTDDPESAPEKGPVFPGEEESVWTYDEVAEAYYYHRFYHFQPDLNTANPAVREEIRKIMGFWLQLGVSGFRVDAATLMIEPKGTETERADDPHELLREMKRFMRHRRGDAVLLAEADDDPPKLADYFGETGEEEMDMLLNFVLNAHVTHALADERARPIVEGLERLPEIPDGGRWANFLRNFDELNIGRLGEASQRAVYERFAPDERMRIYDRGIRRRLAPLLDGDPDRIELAHSLLFSLPGTPIIVSGDEIGMGEDLSLSGRNPVRTPMQWSDEENAGFSTAPEEELVRPVVDEGPFGYERVNVADQRTDPNSLLNRISRLIHAYHDCPEFTRGEHAIHEIDAESVFAHSFVVEGEEEAVLAVHNLAGERRTVEFDPGIPMKSLFALAGEAEAERLDDGGCRVTLDGYDYCWLRTTGVRRSAPVGDDD